MRVLRFLAIALLLGIPAEVGPAFADDPQPVEKPAPLDDETRVRWMAHIIRGLVELATKSDPPDEHYRYCISGFTAFSNLEVSRAVSRVTQSPDESRPWLTPIFIATPDYRPYASLKACPGGQFLFGDIDGDILDMLNTHRRKQRTAIPDWPYALKLEMRRAYGEFSSAKIPAYVFQSGADQIFAAEHGLSRNLSSQREVLAGDCPTQAHLIVFYFRFGNKEVRNSEFEERYPRLRGGGYRLACLTLRDGTLHIDLTDRLYRRADIY